MSQIQVVYTIERFEPQFSEIHVFFLCIHLHPGWFVSQHVSNVYIKLYIGYEKYVYIIIIINI